VEKGENYTETEWAALSLDQQDEALRIEKSVRDFLADSRTIRYVENETNQGALLTFLEGHNLEVSHANLLFAYTSLCADGALELIPFAPVIEPPAPIPTQPPIPSAPSRRAPIAWRNGKQIILEPARPL
jgi:hypothetical protein